MAPKKTLNGEVPYFGLTKFLVIRLALPHLCLWTLSILYCVIGALIFMRLERADNFAASEIFRSEINTTAMNLTLELYSLTRFSEYGPVSRSVWKAIGEQAMNQFIRRIHHSYHKLDHLSIDNGTVDKWAFSRSIFFATTTLTSIGYGNQTPSSRSGKIFCIFFAIVGLPLVVITIADIAKFLSHFILWAFMKYLMFKWRLRVWFRVWRLKRRQRRENLRLQRRHGITSTAIIELMAPKGNSDEEMAEFLWVNLVNAEFVEVPASLMFALIVSYVALGGFYFQSVEENWTFFEGFYFSLISILAIGFGDYTPRNERYIYVSLLYVVLGIVLTTTCIDIVGVDYVNKLHFWGRQLHKVDPLQWLRDVQDRRLRTMKKRAMDALFHTLTALHFMRLDPILLNNMKSLLVDDQTFGDNDPNASTNFTSLGSSQNRDSFMKQRSISLALRRSTSEQTDQKVPPGPPRNFRATSISVHSVTLAWDPPASAVSDDMYYSISYRLRSLCKSRMRARAKAFSIADGLMTSTSRFQAPVLDSIDEGGDLDSSTNSVGFKFWLAPRYAGMTGVDHIPGGATSFTINGLKSFALYQFTLVAVNKVGKGRPVHTQEYTEPSTVPLNIRAVLLSDRFARVAWDPPARNKLGFRHYTIHSTSDANQPFQDWRRIDALSGDNCVDLYDLEPKTCYFICVSADHNRGLATFSRSLQILTLATPAKDIDVVDAIGEEADLDSPRLIDSVFGHATTPSPTQSS